MSAVADGPVWKRGVGAVAELRPSISVMQIADDVGWIQQHDQMLRQVGKGIDGELGVAQEHRSGLGDGEGRAHDCEIYISELLWHADASRYRGSPRSPGPSEHTTFACANFSRSGARLSPAAGGSMQTPPIAPGCP